ncbi:11-beta-hydroxysteroid dehydrogenase 1A [Eucalyptus grandis]|uniref:11-beta-hydroxysteroid dehydrogenase 1A n=1 Tax=Eucalyptus grandis TaxID=71139 RepID=UPI00192EAB09|nr:11-beta-hydroxysteroid dehydrogenase 1A [Eucalyptus grandis]
MDIISAATFLYHFFTGRAADAIHAYLNRSLPPLAAAALLFILPPYLFIKLLLFAFRSAFSEDVAGKVVLITGASSGIGEHLAYSYAKRGACLALVARRENRLTDVANIAYQLGSPDVVVIRGDVTRAEDCERFVNRTIDHFGRLDHLVTNAGVSPMCMFEDCPDITKLAPVMDINFWGSVYSSYFALPYLKRSRGKIVVIASAAGWLPAPRMSFYNASKAALISFYETLRTELGSEITITIVTPGLIESEMTQGKFLSKEGRMVLDPQLRDVQIGVMPIRSVGAAAEEIVKGACRGDNYLTEPAWVKSTFYWKVFCPEVLEWCNWLLLVAGTEISERNALSFKILELTGLKPFLYPPSVQFPDLTETSR